MNKLRKSKLEKIGIALFWLLKTLIIIGIGLALLSQEWAKATLIGLIFLSTYVPTIIKKKFG